MDTILTKIVNDKKIWVEARKEAQPLASFQHQLQPSDRDFYAALTPNTKNKTFQPAFILECKKASPSKGLIREDFDLDYIASVYNQYANVISVITDEKYFQGNIEFISQVRNQVSQPVLCKDFIVDSYQVYLARHYQADAILLMLSVLTDEEYRTLAKIAEQLKLGVLTEVSNEHELTRAIKLEARVVGINNRNLRDLSIDLNRTKELAPNLPADTIIISESGIYTHLQIRELAPHVHGFLIGSSLMAANDLELAVREVLFGNNKVCGLTQAEDASAAYLNGAIYGGLIFVTTSPRCIDISQATQVMTGAPLKYIGVFQNSNITDIVHIAKTLSLTGVQLHGNESPLYVKQLRVQLPSHCQIWKAHGIDNQLPDIHQWYVDKHLFDNKLDQKSGGTGVAFNWSLISENNNDKQNILLSGGLNPDNISQAIALGFAGVDLNSGIEISPGKKDPQKLEAVFTAIKHIQIKGDKD